MGPYPAKAENRTKKRRQHRSGGCPIDCGDEQRKLEIAVRNDRVNRRERVSQKHAAAKETSRKVQNYPPGVPYPPVVEKTLCPPAVTAPLCGGRQPSTVHRTGVTPILRALVMKKPLSVPPGPEIDLDPRLFSILIGGPLIRPKAAWRFPP